MQEDGLGHMLTTNQPFSPPKEKKADQKPEISGKNTGHISFILGLPHNLIKEFFAYLKAFSNYIIKKPKSIWSNLINLIRKSVETFSNLKNLIVRRLIWNRGRLSRPIAHATIATLSLAVFSINTTSSVPTLIKGGMYQIGEVLASSTEVIPEPIQTETELPTNRPSEESFAYTVKDGDTLSSIGAYFNITVDTIRYANNLSNTDYIKPGQELTILPINGIKVKVKSGDTVEAIATKYKVSPQAIVDFNYLNEPFTLAAGQELIVPDANIPAPAPVVTPPSNYAITNTVSPVYALDAYVNIPYAPNAARGTGSFIWPTNFRMVTQYFSQWHPAIDIAPYSPLYASDTGTVIRAGWWPGGYGYAVQIDHGNGYTTTYAHMNQIDVSVGQNVSQGQVIGLMGNTGRSFGTHVHFVIQYYGQYINPLSLL